MLARSRLPSPGRAASPCSRRKGARPAQEAEQEAEGEPGYRLPRDPDDRERGRVPAFLQGFEPVVGEEGQQEEHEDHADGTRHGRAFSRASLSSPTPSESAHLSPKKKAPKRTARAASIAKPS